jgi:enamine deaminase RidA (YjgF/YER057c/UK114 family)
LALPTGCEIVRLVAVRRVLKTGGFEDVGGYARAVRVRDFVAVSATAALDGEGSALHPGDSYAQAREAMVRSLDALAELGASVSHVVRTRLYLAPEADWRRAIDAHRELFGAVTPANTTVFVAGFIPEGVIVEVEVDAIVADE